MLLINMKHKNKVSCELHFSLNCGKTGRINISLIHPTRIQCTSMYVLCVVGYAARTALYYGSGTAVHTASQWHHMRSACYWAADGRCCICSSEWRADVMAAILKLWRHIGNPIPPIDADLIEEQSCQISSRSDLKRRRLRLFEEFAPTTSSWSKNYKKSSVSAGDDIDELWTNINTGVCGRLQSDSLSVCVDSECVTDFNHQLIVSHCLKVRQLAWTKHRVTVPQQLHSLWIYNTE